MPDPTPLFGIIDNPLPKVTGGASYGDVKEGLPAFISNVIGLIGLIGGIAMLITLMLAGLDFISGSGDPKRIEGAWRKINMSLIGLVIIVSAFLVAGIAGQILFGSYTAFLKPKLFGPGAATLLP